MPPASEPPSATAEVPRHVVIMGLMGSGKSTLGSQLAARLGWRYSDSDRELEERTGLTGAQFAETYGVDALHMIEAALVLMALGSDERTVITAAGSTIENETVRRLLEPRSIVAYLDVPVHELERRHQRGSHRRSLGTGELAAQFERRRPLFVRVANLVVPADHDGSTTIRTLMDAVEAR